MTQTLEPPEVITLEQSYSTPATMQRNCKMCSGESPFHYPGCPSDMNMRKDILSAQ